MVIFHRNSGSLAGYPGCNRNHQIWCFNVFPQSIPQAVDFPWKNIKKIIFSKSLRHQWHQLKHLHFLNGLVCLGKLTPDFFPMEKMGKYPWFPVSPIPTSHQSMGFFPHESHCIIESFRNTPKSRLSLNM